MFIRWTLRGLVWFVCVCFSWLKNVTSQESFKRLWHRPFRSSSSQRLAVKLSNSGLLPSFRQFAQRSACELHNLPTCLAEFAAVAWTLLAYCLYIILVETFQSIFSRTSFCGQNKTFLPPLMSWLCPLTWATCTLRTPRSRSARSRCTRPGPSARCTPPPRGPCHPPSHHSTSLRRQSQTGRRSPPGPGPQWSQRRQRRRPRPWRPLSLGCGSGWPNPPSPAATPTCPTGLARPTGRPAARPPHQNTLCLWEAEA